MQVSLPRIWDWIVYKKCAERKIVLKMFVLLYNLQASSTYMPHLQQNANEDVFFLSLGLGQGPIGREAGGTSKLIYICIKFYN